MKMEEIFLHITGGQKTLKCSMVEELFKKVGEVDPKSVAINALAEYKKTEKDEISDKEFFNVDNSNDPPALLVLSYFLFGDKNSDGKMNLEDFSRLVTAIKECYHSPSSLEEPFKAMDSDNDGLISYQDMKQFFIDNHD